MLRTFFLKVNEVHEDGTPDLGGESPEEYGNLDAAIDAGREQVLARYGESVIYECRPVRHIQYGPPRVVKIKEAG